MDAAGILAIALLVLVPLAWEYADLRRTRRIGRAVAFAATLLVVPAVGIGMAAALPLAGRPWLQLAVTVAVALPTYSLAVRAVAEGRGEARASELG